MKATTGRPQPVGRAMQAPTGRLQPVEPGQQSFTASLVLSLMLHGLCVLGLLVSAWLFSRAQPYRLSPHVVSLAGDSPIVIDQIVGEGGGASGARQENKDPGSASKAVPVEASTTPAVEKFVSVVEKPVPPPPSPVPEKSVPAPVPKPVVEKAVLPPPKPVVEKPVPPPTPAPKPVVEKTVPVPQKPPPDAMTLAQKETKPPVPAKPPTSTVTEVQQKVAQLREQQTRQDAAEQRVASLRAEQNDKQAAQQRVAALRTRVESNETGEKPGAGGSGTAGSGSGSGSPGGGKGTGTAGIGGVGTGGLSGIRLRNYQALLQEKITNAWNVPPQSQGLQAIVVLVIERDGRVEQSRLVQKSGNALFDESLQRAIKQAEPLPALPEDYTGRSLEVELRFRPRS